MNSLVEAILIATRTRRAEMLKRDVIEDSEQLNELGAATGQSYMDQAVNDPSRSKMLKLAVRKRYGGAKVPFTQPTKTPVRWMKEDSEELDEARIGIVKARIRGGKIQRRKKVSNVAGYTLRSGQLTRMSPAERRNRRLGQRRGKIKRRAKMTQILMKRTRSLRKRKALGL